MPADLTKLSLQGIRPRVHCLCQLVDDDKDLHRFIWRSSPDRLLRDYRMTRLTFGVSASSFAANMAVKQNALDLIHEYPSADQVVEECFYVDDCLTGSDTIEGPLIGS